MSQNQLIANSGLSALVSSLAQTVHHSSLGQAVGVFADLALLTSFLGVSLGLFEYLGDVIKDKNGNSNRIVSSLITFLPPLGFALYYPKGFILALGYAPSLWQYWLYFFLSQWCTKYVKHKRKKTPTK